MEVGELVQEVKTAILAYQWESDDPLFSQIDLELATTRETRLAIRSLRPCKKLPPPGHIRV